MDTIGASDDDELGVDVPLIVIVIGGVIVVEVGIVVVVGNAKYSSFSVTAASTTPLCESVIRDSVSVSEP